VDSSLKQYIIKSRPISSVLTRARDNFWEEYSRIWPKEEEKKEEKKGKKENKKGKGRPMTAKKKGDEKKGKKWKKRPLTSVIVKPRIDLDW